jgi:hypothetical protein
MAIAEIVQENPNLVVISDEVYKFSIYNPLEYGDSTALGHYHFARLPGQIFLQRFSFPVLRCHLCM